MSEHDDMPELPELDHHALAMLAAFQAEEQPGAAVLERVRGRVLESTAPAPAGSVIRGPWAPWAVVGVVAAAAAALLAVNLSGSDATAVSQRGADQAADVIEMAEGGQAIPQEAEEPKASRTRAAAPVPAEVAPAPEPEPATTGPIADPIPTPPIVEPKPAPSRRPAKKRPAATQQPAPKPVPAKPESSLAAETRLLDRARKAVAGGRAGEALSILRDAQTRFPNGVLKQERAALRVVALCDAGKHEAGRKAAAAFSRAHPRSALRGRVDAACPQSRD